MASKSPKTKTGTKRKLAAILCADVAGYSRLMGADEEATIATLTAYRKVFLSHIEAHHGRVVDAKGDAILAEFASVVDAVNGAVVIQLELAEKNADLADSRRMHFRIGINLGDVVVQDDVIYGDGVNVAARLEALAEPGGVCVSGSAYDQVKNKLKVEYEQLGEQRVKNIAEPVRAYKVLLEPGQAPNRFRQAARGLKKSWRKVALGVVAAVVLVLFAILAWSLYQQQVNEETLAAFQKEAAFPLPDKPSIAVLAFDNLSGDPEQEYFSDGLSEDIITKLASLSPLFVIARNSSFQYKGKQVDVRRIGRELGVRYVLEGSVRKAGGRARITAQLIDAATGEHLFAKRYDRELNDIFAVQDEIAYRVLAELDIKIGRGEFVSQLLRSTNNYEAFDAYMRAQRQFGKFQKEANFRAEELLRKAIDLDPKFASAMVSLGWVYMEQARRKWAPDPKKAYGLSANWVERAIEVQPDHAHGLALMSRFQSLKGNHDEAIAIGKRAVELQPSSASIHGILAFTYLLALQPQASLETINKAMRLAPYAPGWFHIVAGEANYRSGRFEVSINENKKVLAKLKGGPMRDVAMVGLILNQFHLGNKDQAAVTVEELTNSRPEFTISVYIKRAKRFPYKDFGWLEEDAATLRKAGLPE